MSGSCGCCFSGWKTGAPLESKAKSSGCESAPTFCASSATSSARFESSFRHCSQDLKSLRISLAFTSALDTSYRRGEAGFCAGQVSFKFDRSALGRLGVWCFRGMDGEDAEEERCFVVEPFAFVDELLVPILLLLLLLNRSGVVSAALAPSL